jgi:hypothetical protein
MHGGDPVFCRLFSLPQGERSKGRDAEAGIPVFRNTIQKAAGASIELASEDTQQTRSLMSIPTEMSTPDEIAPKGRLKIPHPRFQ